MTAQKDAAKLLTADGCKSIFGIAVQYFNNGENSMTTWTRDDAIWFGRASAESAVDQKYRGDAFHAMRENIRCTLEEYHASEWEYEAWKEFDAVVAKAGWQP
jgi:hypothetical protein